VIEWEEETMRASANRSDRQAGWLAVLLGLVLFVLPAPGLRADINQDEQPQRTPNTPEPEPEGPMRGEAVPVLPPGVLAVTHGLACGDVTAHSAVLWARAAGEGRMHVAFAKDPGFGNAVVVNESAPSDGADDYTASMRIQGLEPATQYWYRVWFTHDPQALPIPDMTMAQGSFRTAPDTTDALPVRFVWGGQLGGDNLCRGHGGYRVLEGMAALAPDFFASLGDMIYADGECLADGAASGPHNHNRPGDFLTVDDPDLDWSDAAAVRETFWKHWRYNRADEHLQRLLAGTTYYATWDDREVRDDFGEAWPSVETTVPPRADFPTLAVEGRDAFLHYAPIDRVPGDVNRIYRSFHCGRDVDLFLLDTRSYRSRNDAPDAGADAKTMLGRAQREWLRRSLIASTAVFKVVVCPAPLSIPVGDGWHGRDGWANGTDADRTGFEHELVDLLLALDQAGVRNVVFLTGNAGWGAEIRYARDFNGDGRPLVFYELAAPPLSAASTGPVDLDTTLQPQPVYREGGFLGFGSAAIRAGSDGKVHLIADIRGEDGKPRPGSTLDIAAQ
jgi:alkaline phosphatase D